MQNNYSTYTNAKLLRYFRNLIKLESNLPLDTFFNQYIDLLNEFKKRDMEINVYDSFSKDSLFQVSYKSLMNSRTSNLPTFESFKNEAATLQNQQNISNATALDQVAKRYGKKSYNIIKPLLKKEHMISLIDEIKGLLKNTNKLDVQNNSEHNIIFNKMIQLTNILVNNSHLIAYTHYTLSKKTIVNKSDLQLVNTKIQSKSFNYGELLDDLREILANIDVKISNGNQSLNLSVIRSINSNENSRALEFELTFETDVLLKMATPNIAIKDECVTKNFLYSKYPCRDSIYEYINTNGQYLNFKHQDEVLSRLTDCMTQRVFYNRTQDCIHLCVYPNTQYPTSDYIIVIEDETTLENFFENQKKILETKSWYREDSILQDDIKVLFEVLKYDRVNIKIN